MKGYDLLMDIIRTTCDIFELLAVFFLAVEAIKLKNLKWVRDHLSGLHRRINPRIQYVDELPHDLSFASRHWFSISLVMFYLLGLLVCSVVLHFLGLSVSEELPRTPLALTIHILLSIVFLPICGLIVYSLVVLAFQLAIVILSAVEENTHSGVVGIIGFILFLSQFVARRSMLP